VKKIWKIHEDNPRLQKVFCSELGISSVMAQLLLNRDLKSVEDAHSFLFGNFASCHDPFLFKDMEKSVLRIKEAAQRNEKILIYGDYDVDGVTSTVLVSFALDELGAKYETFIPNRPERNTGTTRVRK